MALDDGNVPRACPFHLELSLYLQPPPFPRLHQQEGRNVAAGWGSPGGGAVTWAEFIQHQPRTTAALSAFDSAAGQGSPGWPFGFCCHWHEFSWGLPLAWRETEVSLSLHVVLGPFYMSSVDLANGSPELPR